MLGVPVYGLLLATLPSVAFLHHMAITFLVLSAWIVAVTLVKPLETAPALPTAVDIDVSPSRGAWVCGGLIIAATAGLYAIFW